MTLFEIFEGPDIPARAISAPEHDHPTTLPIARQITLDSNVEESTRERLDCRHYEFNFRETGERLKVCATTSPYAPAHGNIFWAVEEEGPE